MPGISEKTLPRCTSPCNGEMMGIVTFFWKAMKVSLKDYNEPDVVRNPKVCPETSRDETSRFRNNRYFRQ